MNTRDDIFGTELIRYGSTQSRSLSNRQVAPGGEGKDVRHGTVFEGVKNVSVSEWM